LSIRSRNIFNPKHADVFNDFEHVWKVADTDSIANIVNNLNVEAKSAEVTVQSNKEITDRLIEDTEKRK
jgi:hypothetical protein